MRKSRSAHRAIFVLESPWGLDKSDANRSSVLPFIEGIAKFAGDVEVLHANFYDKSSFGKALECLAKTRYENALVYIAAHGGKSTIGGVKTGDLLFEVGEVAKSLNVSGVLLGACLAGADTIKMETYTQGTNLRWCAGYSTSVSWLEGTLVDCSILSRMLDLEENEFSNTDLMVDALAEAIAPFSKTYAFGSRKNPTSLDDSLEFIVQQTGSGNRSKTVTSDVFKAWDTKQN